MSKNSRAELVHIVINLAELPAGGSDNYFDKNQLKVLAMNITKWKQQIDSMAKQLGELTERALQDGGRFSTSEPEGI